MKYLFFPLLLLTIIGVSCARKSSNYIDEEQFNFDFEQVEKGVPTGWSTWNKKAYSVYSDSVVVKKNRYSAVIEYKEGTDKDFGVMAFLLPDNYEGKEITLSGYIKTENVTDGYAGLWMRIDPRIAFDNMSGRGVTGTNDWKKYEVTLTMNPAQTEQIEFGVLLAGKGKMWVDDLQVTIDGKGLQAATLYEKRSFLADEDHAFDRASDIVFPSLTDEYITNLELLGKIWGFLKYYHPAVGAGEYNWDYELFRMLPNYMEVTSKAERDRMLLQWIKKYGKVRTCKNCKEAPADAFLKPDLAWLDHSDMEPDLQKELKKIYINRHQGEHYYIEAAQYIRNPKFKHENAYAEMSYPDDGFRLLALYRYWNMIQYFFPNRQLTDKDWNEVLKEYIPVFVNAKDRLAYELATLRVIGEVNDTHANLWGGGEQIAALRGGVCALFRVRFIEDQLVVTEYPELRTIIAERAGVGVIDQSNPAVGDVITHINGQPVKSIVDSLKPWYPASNKAAMLRDMANDILRSPQNEMDITYHSGRQKKEKKIRLYSQNAFERSGQTTKSGKSYDIIDDNIGYITLGQIKNEDVEEIKDSLKNTKGIIIDIRNYPSAFVVFSLGSYFVANDSTPFVKFTKCNVNNPGEFTFTEPTVLSKEENTYSKKVVVIVNEITQSSAEYHAMAFRAGQNTTVIGSTTAGADGNVSAIQLPGGINTMISGIGVFYPDGTDTQRVGIVPDIEVKPTIEGVRKGKDEVLEKAIELIGCKSANRQGLDSFQAITKVFDASEIKDLEQILHFFNAQMCKLQGVDNKDVVECYQRFFKRMEEQEKIGNMDIGISFQEQENMYKQLNERTFNQIWNFGGSLQRDNPKPLKYIGLNADGKYMKYLEELGSENNMMKDYSEKYKSVGDISPTLVANVLNEYKKYDIRNESIQLFIAIHYLTLNDQFKRNEPYEY